MTGIEWTERTWNPVQGCRIVSPGCTNCYAMRHAARLERMTHGKNYAGLTQSSKAGPVWTGKVALASDETRYQPLRRKRPTLYFVNSMSDLFHEDFGVRDIARIFAVMAMSPQHRFQILTKRAARMREVVSHSDFSEFVFDAQLEISSGGVTHRAVSRWPSVSDGLPNVWLGVSVEDQIRADERIPELLQTPAALRFVSAEPLLGPVTLEEISSIDWVICGGESGRGARAMRPEWARGLRDECKSASVPFFFKQWGEYAPVDRGGMVRVGKRAAGNVLDGERYLEMPEGSP